MPVYNASKYLNEAIDSILMQSYKDFELIVINDGFKDNSLDILLSYENKDKRIKVINQKNQGVLKTRLELIIIQMVNTLYL
ncbi:glycosyltransferase family 2 protein [Acholeplasma hippikon]|uniref:Chondroitin polymerase n=1 Tax=Acholeplasma hippikon TaxID=264636 RepID=A0A449BLG1_9MOLU|nr:glycosyltransferase family A protein [Acholeplasma hippikon]VEU83275.1 Chondroitin polymerase [Acholeplasma hippikon]